MARNLSFISRGRGLRVALLTAAMVLPVAGCGSAQESGVEDVATSFYQAVSDGDGEAACDLLGPATRSELEQSAGKPCAEALPDEDVPEVDAPLDVRVFGTQAEVRWPGETTFLARFQGGWKVMAAACTPRPHQPYDCAISGG